MSLAAAVRSESFREDLYPSRTGRPPRLLPRRDPVVYGDRPDGLSAEQWAGYERDGYLFLESLLSPCELQDLVAELGRLWREYAGSERCEVVGEPDSREVRSIFAVHRLSEMAADLARSPRLLGIVEAVLGSAAYVHQSRINFKPGFVGREFYWHSDFETWHVEDGMPRMRALSLSLSLCENNPHNGPLMVIPGSHRHYVACPGRTPEHHYRRSLVRQEYGVPGREHLAALVEEGGIVAPCGGPGSLLMFDCNVMHGSNSNISPFPRSNLFLVFNSVENRLVEPFCGLPPRPEHVASRRSMPKLTSRPSA